MFLFGRTIRQIIIDNGLRAAREDKRYTRVAERMIYEAWKDRIREEKSLDGLCTKFSVSKKVYKYIDIIKDSRCVKTLSNDIIKAAYINVKAKHPGLIMKEIGDNFVEFDFSNCLDEEL